VMYLRAGYYVQYSDPTNVGAFGAQLDTTINNAFNAFFASSHIGDVNQAHGQTLGEVITLIVSSKRYTQQLSNVLAVMNRYGPSYQAHSYMQSAVNNVFSVLYNGQFNPEFVVELDAQA